MKDTRRHGLFLTPLTLGFHLHPYEPVLEKREGKPTPVYVHSIICQAGAVFFWVFVVLRL